MELTHSLVGFTSCLDELFVAHLKLFAFLFCVAKSLGHANARNTALKRCVYLSN